MNYYSFRCTSCNSEFPCNLEFLILFEKDINCYNCMQKIEDKKKEMEKEDKIYYKKCASCCYEFSTPDISDDICNECKLCRVCKKNSYQDEQGYPFNDLDYCEECYENLCATKFDHKEMVNHPDHYKSGGIAGMEAIDIIEKYKMNFNLGNCLKYLIRCERKGTKKQDLNKLIWYAQREIDQIPD